MINKIKQKIYEIEEREQVKIIYATESGSCAWGFASPNSDYNVRFIYIRKPEFYLKLEKTKDFIEYELNDIFDNYIKENFERLNNIINNLPKIKNNNYEQLNNLFLNIINFKTLC